MIRLEQIEKSYGTKLLFSQLTYHFPEGETIALVGDNGAGKTTLLNIICSLEAPDAGAVLVPPSTTIGYLPQEPNPHPRSSILEECEAGESRSFALKQAMAKALLELEGSSSAELLHRYEQAEAAYRQADGYALAGKASTILAGLGFKPAQLLASPLSLSGGWRMRLELAKLFMRNPDFLLLDEPTNHLDLPSLVWVENYLRTFPGTILFVSHDRDLLNRLATMILHLNQGKLTPYQGNFDNFLAGFALVQSQEAKEKAQLAQKRKQLETFVTRFGAKATKAKQAQAKLKIIGRLDAQAAQLSTTKLAAGISFSLPSPPPVDRITYRIESGSIGYHHPLHRNINLQIERGQKIAVIGANGIGKSTLIKTLSGVIPPLGGAWVKSPRALPSYFSQNQLDELDASKSVLENMLEKTPATEREARQVLGAFLFKGDDVFKPVKVLSGGEKSRLGLGIILAQQANLLLLDEPTNHLDLASCARLTKALQEYQGTVFFVSHDRQFINEICTHVFVMTDDGRSMLFPGTIDDYLRLAPQAQFPNVLESVSLPESSSGKKDSRSSRNEDEQRSRELKKQRDSIDRQLVNLEAELDKLHQQCQAIDQQMADPGNSQNFSELHRLQEQRNQLATELTSKEEIWLELKEQHDILVSKLQELNRA